MHVNRSNAPKNSLLPIYLLFRFNFYHLLQLKINLVSFCSTYVCFLKINTFLLTQKVGLFLSTKRKLSWESVSKRECVSLRKRKTDCVPQCNSLKKQFTSYYHSFCIFESLPLNISVDIYTRNIEFLTWIFCFRFEKHIKEKLVLEIKKKSILQSIFLFIHNITIIF